MCWSLKFHGGGLEIFFSKSIFRLNRRLLKGCRLSCNITDFSFLVVVFLIFLLLFPHPCKWNCRFRSFESQVWLKIAKVFYEITFFLLKLSLLKHFWGCFLFVSFVPLLIYAISLEWTSIETYEDLNVGRTSFFQRFPFFLLVFLCVCSIASGAKLSFASG